MDNAIIIIIITIIIIIIYCVTYKLDRNQIKTEQKN